MTIKQVKLLEDDELYIRNIKSLFLNEIRIGKFVPLLKIPINCAIL